MNPIIDFNIVKRVILNLIKLLYIIFASIMIWHLGIGIWEQIRQGRIHVQEHNRVLPKIKYPSITFCYKYKHGSKKAIHTYSSYFAESWKQSGNKLVVFYK